MTTVLLTYCFRYTSYPYLNFDTIVTIRWKWKCFVLVCNNFPTDLEWHIRRQEQKICPQDSSNGILTVNNLQVATVFQLFCAQQSSNQEQKWEGRGKEEKEKEKKGGDEGRELPSAAKGIRGPDSASLRPIKYCYNITDVQ